MLLPIPFASSLQIFDLFRGGFPLQYLVAMGKSTEACDHVTVFHRAAMECPDGLDSICCGRSQQCCKELDYG